jgi:hypothetical protein
MGKLKNIVKKHNNNVKLHINTFFEV